MAIAMPMGPHGAGPGVGAGGEPLRCDPAQPAPAPPPSGLRGSGIAIGHGGRAGRGERMAKYAPDTCKGWTRLSDSDLAASSGS